VITRFGVYAAVGLAVLAVGAYVFYKARERRLARRALGTPDEAPGSDDGE
jgi:hypothetical protein